MDERKKLIKNENDDMTSDKKDLDDEECEYSYKKTWKGYKHCLNFAVFVRLFF